MKKIFFIITLCVVCATSYGQDVPDSNETNKVIIIKPSWNMLKYYSKYAIQEYLQVPMYIRDHYDHGIDLMKIGCGTIVVGTLSCIYATIMFATKINPTGAIVTMGIGASLIGVSIPLFCFGTHTKRESNVMYQLYRDHKIHMINYH